MMQSTCPFFTVCPTSANGLAPGSDCAIERADDRRLHDRQVDVLVGRRQDRRAGARAVVARAGAAASGGTKVTCGSGGTAPFHCWPDVLAQPQLDAVPLELELGQVVLAHHFQNLLDLV